MTPQRVSTGARWPRLLSTVVRKTCFSRSQSLGKFCVGGVGAVLGDGSSDFDPRSLRKNSCLDLKDCPANGPWWQ